MKDDLVESMKVVLADTFSLYLRAHNYHWNVEGKNFVQLHDFFGDLYGELHGAIDPIAENIRKLGAYAPGSLERFKQLTTLDEELNVPDDHIMVARLSIENDKVMLSLRNAYTKAEEMNEIGLSNFLQDRYDIHAKYRWMLNSIIKG